MKRFLVALLGILAASQGHSEDSTKNKVRLSVGQQRSILPPNDFPPPELTEPLKTDATADNLSNRMKTLQGSESRWSGQLNFTYTGSSLSHPFSAEAPNPGNQVPPPLVTLNGTVSGRYRIDPQTTAGLGLGVLTQTPFQGPKNTTLADPYIDIARNYKMGPLENRADFEVTLWTNYQYHDLYGYLFGFTALNETYYTFDFGLTVGLLLQIDANFFASGSKYDPSQRTEYDFYTDPYFEYRLSKQFNLRSVIGIPSLHNQNLTGFFNWYHPSIYQTFGVGISLSRAAYIYPFIQFFPFSGNVSTQTTLVGFNTIINLL